MKTYTIQSSPAIKRVYRVMPYQLAYFTHCTRAQLTDAWLRAAREINARPWPKS